MKLDEPDVPTSGQELFTGIDNIDIQQLHTMLESVQELDMETINMLTTIPENQNATAELSIVNKQEGLTEQTMNEAMHCLSTVTQTPCGVDDLEKLLEKLSTFVKSKHITNSLHRQRKELDYRRTDEGLLEVDIQPVLQFSQHKVAKFLGLAASTLSKRWREASCNLDWPQRNIKKYTKIQKNAENILENKNLDDKEKKKAREKVKAATNELAKYKHEFWIQLDVNRH